MLRSLPSAIGVLDTLYEPNSVFGQFLRLLAWYFFPYRTLLYLLVWSCLVLSFILFSFFASFSFLFFVFPIDLSLTCVCVVISTTCNKYVVVFSGWQAA